MKCPIDVTVDLVMTDRSGVEIDYCPVCRGVWLDRGELDKIIERSGSVTRRDDRDDDDRHDDRKGGRRGEYTASPKKKKSSFLGDLFEF